MNTRLLVRAMMRNGIMVFTENVAIVQGTARYPISSLRFIRPLLAPLAPRWLHYFRRGRMNQGEDYKIKPEVMPLRQPDKGLFGGLAQPIERRHDLPDEQADGAGRFLETEVAEREPAHEVIDPGVADLPFERRADRVRRARKALAALLQFRKSVAVERRDVRRRGAVALPQAEEIRAPNLVGAFGNRLRLPVGLGDHDMTVHRHERDLYSIAAGLRPFAAIALDDAAHHRGRTVDHDVETMLGRPDRRLGLADAVPQRRMRFLHRRDLERHIAKAVERADVIEGLAGERLHQDFIGLEIARLALGRRNAVVLDLV